MMTATINLGGKEVVLFLAHALTPLHAGSGADISWIDLPLQREVHTGLPIIQASGVKGTFREVAEKDWGKERTDGIFGPDTEESSEYSSAIAFTDLRLLLFPVRSWKGIFVWASCPLVLERLRRDLQVLGLGSSLSVPEIDIKNNNALVADKAVLVGENRLILEDFVFEAREDHGLKGFAQDLQKSLFPGDKDFWGQKLETSLVILSDESFLSFVRFSTEVVTRIKINNETGVVQEGALWTEEHLPTESILYGFALAEKVRRKDNKNQKDAKWVRGEIIKLLDNKLVWMGGDITVGRGMVKLTVLNGR